MAGFRRRERDLREAAPVAGGGGQRPQGAVRERTGVIAAGIGDGVGGAVIAGDLVPILRYVPGAVCGDGDGAGNGGCLAGRGCSGVGFITLHLHRAAVPVDVEAHRLAHIPETDIVAAPDEVGGHRCPLAVHIDELVTERGGEVAGRLGGGAAQGESGTHAHGKGDGCPSFFHNILASFL